MRFMIMVKSKESSAPPPKELMDGIAQLGQEAAKAGVFVDTGGLLPTAMGARVRVSGGQISVTDGPFTEAKEVVGGFAVYQVKSREEAVAWTRRFMELHAKHWKGWEGEAEVRQMFDPSDFGGQS
ncbi:MAG TPA: YciI family protein [Gemmatimonadales bacterium]|jgi:hypothetical protein